MGNSSSNNQQHTGLTIHNKHLGTLTRTHAKQLSKVISFPDPHSFHEALSQMNNRMKRFINHQHILTIHSIQQQQIQDICSYGGHITIHLQSYQTDLQTLLANKISNMEHFQEEQLWRFLREAVEALLQIHDNGLKTIHIDASSIILCNTNQQQQHPSKLDHYQIKLIDGSISIGPLYPRLMCLLQCKKETLHNSQLQQLISGLYLSPELLEELRKGNPQPCLSPKQDVFSLAMLTVSMCCLENLDAYYNYDEFTFDYENLIYRISKMVYSQQLKQTLAQMLEYHCEERIGLVSLLQKLSQPRGQRKSLEKPRSSSTKILSELLLSTSRNKSQKTNKTILSQKSNTSIDKPKHQNSTSLSLKNKLIHNSAISPNDFKPNQTLYTDTKPNNNYDLEALRNIVKKKTNTNLVNINANKYLSKQQAKENQYQCNDSDHSKPMTYIDRIKYLHNSDLQKITSTKINYQQPNIKIVSNTEQPLSHKILSNKSYLKVSNTQRHNQSIYKITQSSLQSSDKHSEHKISGRQSEIQSPNYKIQMKNVPIADSMHLTNQQSFNHTFTKPTPLKPFQMLNLFKKSQIKFKIMNDYLNVDNNHIDNLKGIDCHTFNLNKMHNTPITNKMHMQDKQRVTLDEMYKTAQSINNSQQKDITFIIETSSTKVSNNFDKIIFQNGYQYEGELTNNKMEGNGILYDGYDRTIYSGSWMEGQYHGFGTLNRYDNIGPTNWKDLGNGWIKYEGEFFKGQRQGFGTLYFQNGGKFSGSFKGNLVDGYGCFYLKEGKMVSGLWQNNFYRNL